MPGVGAGTAPAGYPVITPAAPAAGAQDGLMPYFDLATRTFPFAADGSLLLVHPVDQAVELTLGTTRGTIKSAPDHGVDWKRIRAALYAETPKVAAGEIARALAPFVQAGDVELRAVRFTRPAPGRQLVEVDYVNLRLPLQNGPATGVRTARGSV
jgi:hypothetical protein